MEGHIRPKGVVEPVNHPVYKSGYGGACVFKSRLPEAVVNVFCEFVVYG